MQVRTLVDELIHTLQGAKAVPLSTSCIVNREQVLELLTAVQQSLPTELSQASSLLREREALIEDGRAEADRIVEMARAEAAVLVSRERVYREAVAESAALKAATEEECLRQRRELDDYVDAKLAAFEAALTKTLDAVAQGREKTQVRLAQAMHDDDGHEASAFFRDWHEPRAHS